MSSKYSDPEQIIELASNPSENTKFGDIVARRYSRRHFVKGGLAVTAGASIASLWGCAESEAPATLSQSESTTNTSVVSSFDFTEISHGGDAHIHVAPDHNAEVLIRWGDPLFSDTPEFDPLTQTAEKQEHQFGFNNDYVGFLSLEPEPHQEARALLCVNHEYPRTTMMFTGMDKDFLAKLTPDMIEIEKAATGCSVVEIELVDGNWRYIQGSEYNRRISARSTEFEITGPAAAHPRMQSNYDATGTMVIGTMNNCAGGMTPWGTYLSCEENIDDHFSGILPEGHPETENHNRYGVPSGLYHWGRFDNRFNLAHEPNEPNRFGWVVEIDPKDPNSVPKKRTALGRFKHEGAETVIAPDGRLVIYMGDDERFDYLYKFVTEGLVDLETPENNRDLLDYGTLYVAKFHDNGALDWLPLIFGNQPLTEENNFSSQAEVLIEARRAADLLGATPMDRPEDVVPNAKTGKVYVMLTNNTLRKPEETNAANPRGPNPFGHIVEVTEPEGDFTATKSQWDFLIKAGDPNRPEVEAMWHSATSENGWFASPDNGAIDPSGRLWVSTDQSTKVALSGTNDGLWAVETEGELRGTGKMFFRCPTGAELCGPVFSDDGESLFLAVQHPGEDDNSDDWINFDNPSTRWPDFNDDLPPRPSVVVVRRNNAGKVG